MLCRSFTAEKLKQGGPGQASKHFKIALHVLNKKNSTIPDLPDQVTAAHDPKALLPGKTDLQNHLTVMFVCRKARVMVWLYTTPSVSTILVGLSGTTASVSEPPALSDSVSTCIQTILFCPQ